MKKIIILIVLAFINISCLNAFNGYIPASEMSDEFMKFSTYYQKQHFDYENGFSDIGMIFTYPKIGKMFGIGGEFHRFGDQKYQRFETNALFSFKPVNFLTTVVSAGLVSRSFNDLNFMEAEELPQGSKNAFVAGISSNINIQNRLNIGVGFYNLNKPNVSFLGGVDKLPLKILLNADAIILNWLGAGVYLLKENEKNYYGLKLNFSLPLKNMHIETQGSSENKVSSYITLNTLNYWNFKIGYETYLESQLKSSNYSIFISKKIVGDLDAPIIEFPNNEWNKDYRDVQLPDIPLRFSILKHDRLKNVKVLLNKRTVLEKNAIMEYEKKDFKTNLPLRNGDNTLIISATGINGKVNKKRINIYYKSSDIQILPIAKEINLGDEIDIVWESTINNGKFGIFLYENDVEKKKLNKGQIKDPESEEGTSKKYRYTWKAKEIQNGKGHKYRIRIKEYQLGFSSETNEFTGDITEPTIKIWENEIEIPYIKLAGRVEDKSDISYIKINGVDVDEINKLKSNKWKFTYYGKLSIGHNTFLIETEDKYGNKTQQTISKKRDYEYADIDNISESRREVSNRIGVVLGIENYDNIESAKYANRDAETVKDYFTKRLGIAENNIFYLSENTKTSPQTIPIKSLFETDLKEKCNHIRKSYENVEIIIYYSGHGLPDEEDNSNFYLLPIDFNQRYKKTKISFNDDVLSEIKKYIQDDDLLVILMDACFSGKKRGSDELIAYLGSKPASLLITIQQAFNNMIMFSSSSGLQRSYSYDRAQHGLFTYAFLRALNEFDTISMKELANYIKTTTETISGIDTENISEIQQPDVIPSELLEKMKTNELGEVKF